jgi:uncharacterized membrane protein YkvA (DUF1232 family)
MASMRRVSALRALAAAIWGARSAGAPGIGERFGSIPRMLALGFTGRYPYLRKGRVLLMFLGLAYIVSPVDLIPELLLPVLGLTDDTLVAAWVAGAVLSETEAYLGWEREARHDRARVVVGEVVEEGPGKPVDVSGRTRTDS